MLSLAHVSIFHIPFLPVDTSRGDIPPAPAAGTAAAAALVDDDVGGVVVSGGPTD